MRYKFYNDATVWSKPVTKAKLYRMYIVLIDKEEYYTFSDWLTDMFRMDLVREVTR